MSARPASGRRATSAPATRRGRRRFWPVVAVLLVAVPVLEIWLLIQVGRAIGGWPTVLILVAEAVLGGVLVRRAGARAWRSLNGALTSGRMPSGELADAALVLVGGVLLLVPGFVTDVLGLLFLLPFTRPLARRLLTSLVARRLFRVPVPVSVLRRGTVIEGETVARPGASGSEPVVLSGEVEDGRR